MTEKSPKSPTAPQTPEHPGLTSRRPATVADAIPTEAEGDALFDELFGGDMFGDDDEVSDEQDIPLSAGGEPATVLMQRSPLLGASGPTAGTGTPLGLGPPHHAAVQPHPPQQPLPPPPPLQRPLNQPPMGQPPVGQPPVGQPPVGQAPLGPPPMGQAPLGPPPKAQPPLAQRPLPPPHAEDEEHITNRPPDYQEQPYVAESTQPIAAPTLGEVVAFEADDVVDDAADTGQHHAIRDEDLADTNQYPRADLPPGFPKMTSPLPRAAEPSPPAPPPFATSSILDDESTGDDAIVLDDAVVLAPGPDTPSDAVMIDDDDSGSLPLAESGVDFGAALRRDPEPGPAFEEPPAPVVPRSEAVTAPPEAAPLDLDEIDLAAVEAADDNNLVSVAVDDAEAFAYVDDGAGSDAVVALMQSGQRDAWVDRALWLYAEAPEANRALERARALLVVSEMLAMAGEEERAESVAREAVQLAPSLPLAHRQLRGLLMSRGRWTEVADALDAEARLAPTGEAKLHATYLGAEVARLAQGDPDGASRRLDAAERVSRGDARVPVARLMQALASSDEVAAPHLDPEVGAALSGALEELRAIRSDGAAGSSGGAFGALLGARAALRKRDVAGAVRALDGLVQNAEFSSGAAWLASALAAPHAELRRASLDALALVSDGSHGALATRARAARALELGDAKAVEEVARSASDDVLSPSERLVLCALTGASLADPAAVVSQASVLDAPLAAAAASVLGDGNVAVGEAKARAAVGLGRALARASAPADGGKPLGTEEEESASLPMGALVRPSTPPDAGAGLASELVEAAGALLDADDSAGAARAVLLEHQFRTGQVAKVADALSGDNAGGLEVERSLAVALLSELAGDHQRMAAELERVVSARPDDESAARMSMVIAEPAVAGSALVRVADASTDDVRAAIALTEAGLRLMEEEGQEADGEALLRRAADKSPDVPIAGFIGMYIAQAMGDAASEQHWLAERRRAAATPADAVMDNVRQALRLPASDKQERAALLEEASRARPDDYCLRELYEQSGAPEDRAAWLMGRVGEGATAAAAPLALEAALAAELEGDYELAARCAQRAIELGDQRLAPVFARRLAFRGHGVEAILEGLQAELRQAREPSLRAELLEYMAQIEARGRGDREAATALLRTLVSEQPGHLAALHAIEAMAIAQGDVSGIADVCMLITQALEGGEMIAHAQLAARLLQQQGRWEDSYDAVKVAASVAQPSHWALRQMLAHSRARGDHAVAAGIACALAEGARATLDRATLLLRGAEGSQAGGDDGAASDLLGEVLELWPRHQVALAERAALLERLGKAADAARCLEDLAMACQAPQHRIERLYQAAVLWLSQENAEGQDEGRRLLEAVGTIDATYKDTFERLQAIYLAAGAKRELAELLAARLDGVTDPEERIELEVLRGKMLVEAGSAGEAREALSAALEANPDNPEALSAFADVCAAEGEWEQVEQAIIRLGRLVSDPAKQCEIYLRLGALYDEHLPNLERAEMAYQEVLKRAPDNTRARAKLVDLFLKSGDTQRAFAEQEELINAAKSQEEKCDRTVKLAEIFEASGDPKQAEQTLIKARRTWAKEAGPVAALYRFYKRTGQGPAADMLLDRAAADVRRGLGAGRFEAQLFAMAQTVADLRGQADAAVIARATLSAITGEPAAIEGVGLLAGQPELDEHTAPEVLTTAFRQLLKATGDVMDEAVPFDLKAVRAKPLPPPHADVLERTREIAAAYGLPDVQVLATNALGNTCIPARSEPPTLCMGLPLVTAEEAAVREFLIHRAVKVLQTRTAALSRTAPIDLWPLMAAYLQLHSSSFQPHGVDPTKVAMFKEKMGPAMPPPDPQLSLLASDVIGTIGNRASSLNTVTNSWGSRAALLALGDPNLALEAIAWAGGATSPPADPGERVRWIGRQAEARDLIVFSVSDGYATARATLGADASMLDAVEFIDADPE